MSSGVSIASAAIAAFWPATVGAKALWAAGAYAGLVVAAISMWNRQRAAILQLKRDNRTQFRQLYSREKQDAAARQDIETLAAGQSEHTRMLLEQIGRYGEVSADLPGASDLPAVLPFMINSGGTVKASMNYREPLEQWAKNRAALVKKQG